MEAFLAFGGRDITSPFPGLSIEQQGKLPQNRFKICAGFCHGG
jgi:hypothetical protein